MSDGFFAELLGQKAAHRATAAIRTLLDHGLRGALTGGLAVEAQLRARGCSIERRQLNDIDFVIAGFDAIPDVLAGWFLCHHVHPDASDGRTLLQLIDERAAMRVDLFRELGKTLTRAVPIIPEMDDLPVVSIEDLAARTTALVCGRLGRGRTLDPKHARAFARLRGLGRAELLTLAWADHRQQVRGTFAQASREAERLLDQHPELMVPDVYDVDPPPCHQCRSAGPFGPAPRHRITAILGYC